MLGNSKTVKLIFDHSAFSVRELGTKCGKACHKSAYNPLYILIQAHCNVYKFVCSTKLIHRFLHEKYALMRVLLFFIANASQLGTHSFFPSLRNLPLNSFLGLLLECFEGFSQFALVSIVI